MKKVTSLVLTLIMVIGIVCIPVTANAATESFNLKLGETYIKTIEEPSTWLSSNSHEYSFTMTESCNVAIVVATKSSNISFSFIKPSSYSYFTDSTTITSPGAIAYLKKGNTYKIRVSGSGEYGVKVAKTDPDKITSKGKTLKITAKKVVTFKFSGTTDYAKDRLSVKSSNKKVATADVSVSGNTGTLTINPYYIGKTVITVKMGGSNSIKYTVHGTDGYWFVAKGSKAKAPKPSGVKKPKWSSSKKKIATIKKKTGKIKAKKGGRVTFTAKKGKNKYRVHTVVTDYIKLGKKAYKEIKNNVNNPDKLKIYNVYKGFSKQIDSKFKVPVIVIDYGSTNDNGAMVRNKTMAFYDEVYQIHYTSGWSIDNIISRKSIKPSKIK
ncbi:MAG: hypothetical protein IJ903_01050 [Ruminococcus sp.]|nr:hypothetical protein [Ruminococcus sp.]